MAEADPHVALIVGASRGLGFGLTGELLGRGWEVIATARDADGRAALNGLSGRLEVEHVDINHPDEIAALRSRLDGRGLDLLFVNAGVGNDPAETIGDVSTDEFVRVMTTNALSPMRVVAGFTDLVRPDGVVAVMSSGLGSVTANTIGGYEVYRGSKAALNTLLRSFAARHAEAPVAFVAIAPGWVRTDMGGPTAPLDVETSTRGVADVVTRQRGARGSAFLDYRGETLPW